MSAVRLADLRGKVRDQALAKLGLRDAAPTRLQRELHRAQTSEVNDLFARQLAAAGLPFETEVKLVLDRGWRWDAVVHRLAIEVQGGVWTGGAHTRGWGVARDIEKSQAAVRAGYIPLFVTAQQVRDDDATSVVRDALTVHGWWMRICERRCD